MFEKLSRKSRVGLLIIIPLAFGIFIAIAVFYYFHPTHYCYNDRFVIGSTVDEITERYGEFDKATFSEIHPNDDPTLGDMDVGCAGYLVREERIAGFLSSRDAQYYCIYFNQAGVATRVRIVDSWIGD